MTKYIKNSEIKNDWYEIDAKGAVVGRLATIISKIIRGKNKANYTPHMDNGDFVVVKNIEQIKFTGNKFKKKKYYKHTGYPGGIKETTPERGQEVPAPKTIDIGPPRLSFDGSQGSLISFVPGCFFYRWFPNPYLRQWGVHKCRR